MELSLEFWYLLPISLMIATIAMSTGVGGAVFFSPLFMLVLGLEPTVAIGTALATELFGFTSGLIAYSRARLIDYKLAMNLLLFSLPLAILGTFYGSLIPSIILKAIFAVGIIFIGYQIFSAWRKEEREKKETEYKNEFADNFESELTDAKGNTYRYTVCNKNTGRLFAAIGGGFLGMISVGLAELQEYQLVARCKVPTPVAVGTSIFVVVITVLVASIGHFYAFSQESPETVNQVVNLLLFTAPGVIAGGQIGAKLQSLLPEDKMKVGISVLFVLIGIFMLFTLLK
ncbi:MAG: sulfite exporter TauE/SafE family protein [Bacteroidetes bacterium HGW-Bacteroidetes-1]|jgi:hypothetical protein|nr:MAG: sulfite exporter TauE/SafE family protein [Bacteroidetes bacterium HGW-Bacteroidetes-1]